MLSKPAIIELTYNTLVNQIDLFKRQRNLSNDDMEVILTRLLQDIKTARLIESADLIFRLTQEVEALKKEEKNDKPDDQSELNTGER